MSELVELRKRISGLFEQMNLDVPSENTNLFETGLLDSMTLVQLLLKLEEQLGVSVSVDQLDPDNFRSIQHIASFVLANQQLPTIDTRARISS
jgi:D-alanine--poly(phosphoribitol) ligase subunit 2